MSRYQQQSWEFKVPRDGQTTVITFSSGDLYKPKEFMHVLNKHGKIKIHALVDGHTEETVKKVLIVGTGGYIDEEIIDQLLHIGSVTFSDGQFGYHFYLISEAVEVARDDLYKEIQIEFNDLMDHHEHKALRDEIIGFVRSYPNYMEYSEIDVKSIYDTLNVRLKNKDAAFEKTPVFRDFILNLSVSDQVDVNVTNI
jgi:hypothetical protein